MALLTVDDVRVEFGGIVALSDLSFDIDAGQICALIGPNGAGKTTLFNLLTGFLAPTSGQILYRGEDITGRQPEEIARNLLDQAGLTPEAQAACDTDAAGAAAEPGLAVRSRPGRPGPERFPGPPLGQPPGLPAPHHHDEGGPDTHEHRRAVAPAGVRARRPPGRA